MSIETDQNAAASPYRNNRRRAHQIKWWVNPPKDKAWQASRMPHPDNSGAGSLGGSTNKIN